MSRVGLSAATFSFMAFLVVPVFDPSAAASVGEKCCLSLFRGFFMKLPSSGCHTWYVVSSGDSSWSNAGDGSRQPPDQHRHTSASECHRVADGRVLEALPRHCFGFDSNI